VGVLPSEEDLTEVRENYSEVFKTLLKHSDAQFFIDNDALKTGARLRGRYNTINKQIFRYFNSLFEVGEVKSRDEVGTEAVSTGDTITTLTGVSTIGIGEHVLDDKGLSLFRSKKKEIDKPELIISLAKEASKNLLTGFDLKDAQKALVVVSGPKKHLDFLGSIPARLWVEKKIDGEVRGGDMPSADKKNLQVMLVFSGIKKSEKIRELYRQSKKSGKETESPDKTPDIYEKLEAIGSKVSDLKDELSQVSEEFDEILGQTLRDDE
jgi:cell division GTPase FtsZ